MLTGPGPEGWWESCPGPVGLGPSDPTARLADVTHQISLSLAQARRIALAAQGFGRPRPGVVASRQVGSVLGRLGQFQIDSVNVAVRAHYMPLFSRLGSYQPALLDRARDAPPRRVFEYWGHAASLIDVALYPAFAHRMAEMAGRPWRDIVALDSEQPTLVGRIADFVAENGPVTAREVEHPEERVKGSWWNWSQAKVALEWLFAIGTVTVAGRNSQFERRYDLPGRALPAAVAAAEPLSSEEASVVLIRRAAAALGIASLRCLADYFRMSNAATRAAVEHLRATGELVPARVNGWGADLWWWSGSRRPRRIETDALVSPFDSLVFERRRLEALFDLHYRIEIYTPAAQRRYGYYVYLFLADEAVAARVDLKADRTAGRLIVQASWLEAGAEAVGTARRLAASLAEMARWQGLSAVEVRPCGSLAPQLALAVG